MRDEFWRDEAACQGQSNLFERAALSPQDASAVSRAIEVCGTCSVITECLAYAMKRGEHGIWGGTNLRSRLAHGGTPPDFYNYHPSTK